MHSLLQEEGVIYFKTTSVFRKLVLHVFCFSFKFLVLLGYNKENTTQAMHIDTGNPYVM